MGLSRRQRLFVVFSGLFAVAGWLLHNPDAPDIFHEDTKSLIIFAALIIVWSIGAYWKWSPQWFRLSNRMISMTTDGTYGNKRSNLRAVGLGLLAVLIVLAAICIYAIYFYNGGTV